MSIFVKLDAAAQAHLDRLRLFTRLKRRHQLALHADRATVRLAAAAKNASASIAPGHLRWLAEVTAHESDAYARLAGRPNAIRYCQLHIAHALDVLGIVKRTRL
jgi:hypothetical protein